MTANSKKNRLKKNINKRSQVYKSFVGPSDTYDIVSAIQFNLLTALGLREYHFFLDIGCGSLRGGRLFLSYLLPCRYYGIEPEKWLLKEGIKNECGADFISIKKPVFSNDNNFTLSSFNMQFDFILAQSIFSHASQPQIRRCLDEAKKIMKPTSIFTATFLEGEKNYTGKKWIYPGCVTYTFEHMKKIVREQGLVCKPIEWPHPNKQTWVAIINPENENNISGFSNHNKLTNLENELKFCRDRLEKIECHPYVKFGVNIYRQILRVKKWIGKSV